SDEIPLNIQPKGIQINERSCIRRDSATIINSYIIRLNPGSESVRMDVFSANHRYPFPSVKENRKANIPVMSDHFSSSDEDLEDMLDIVEIPKNVDYFEETVPLFSAEQYGTNIEHI
ncbi:hypothetical protein WA026_011573, partial [Henosepilachna vigintioctopunctata]